MAEWRERGYVPDSDDDEEEQWDPRPPKKDAPGPEPVPETGAARRKRAEPYNDSGDDGLPQEVPTAKAQVEPVDANLMADCPSERPQKDLLVQQGLVPDAAANEIVLDRLDHKQAVSEEKEVSISSVADQLEAVLNDSLQTVHEFLGNNPIAPATPNFASSEDSSPLSSLGDLDEDMDLGNFGADLTVLVHNLPEAVPRDSESALRTEAVEQNQRRELRQRKAIQVHPYALEDAQYQETLKARGLKPLRIVEKINGGSSSTAHDTRYDSLLSSSQADIPTSSMPSLPSVREHSVMPVHYESDSDEDAPLDLGKAKDADDLPDVSDILNGRRIISTSTRKRSHIRPKRTAARPTGDLSRAYTLADDGPGADFFPTADHDMFHVPPSPPQSAGCSDPTSSSAGTTRSRPGVNRTPRGLPTPIVSSEYRGQKRSVAELIDSSNTSQIDISDDDPSPVSSDTDSQRGEKLTEIKRRIKGVLPASWLKLDLKKQTRCEDAHAVFLSPTKTTKMKGVARHMASTLHHFSSAGQRLIDAETFVNGLVSEDDTEGDASDTVHCDTPDLVAIGGPEDLMDDAVIEENDVSPMAPREVRGGRHLGKPRQQQKALRESWPGLVKYRPRALTSEANNVASYHRGVEKRDSHIRRKHKRQRRNSSLQLLSVLDAPGFLQPSGISPPRFLKIAARKARRRAQRNLSPDYQRPERKCFTLADHAETEEINQVLYDWQLGRAKRVHQHRKSRVDYEAPIDVPQTSLHDDSRAHLTTPNPESAEPSNGVVALKKSTKTTLQRLFARQVARRCSVLGQDGHPDASHLLPATSDVIKLAVRPAPRLVMPTRSRAIYPPSVSREPRPAAPETTAWQNSVTFRPRISRKQVPRYRPVPQTPPKTASRHSETVDTIRSTLTTAHAQCVRATGSLDIGDSFQDSPEKIVRDVVRKYKDNGMKEIFSQPDPRLPGFLQSLVGTGFPTYFPIEPQDPNFHVCLKVLAMSICCLTTRLHNIGPDLADTDRMQKITLGKLQSFVFALSPNSGDTLHRDEALSLEDLAATTNRCSLYSTLYAYAPPACRPRLSQIIALVDISKSHNEACTVILRTWEMLVGYQISGDENAVKLEEFSGWIRAIVDQTVSKYRSAEEEVTTQLRAAGALVDPYALSIIRANQQSTAEYLILVLRTWEKALKACRTAAQARHLLGIASIDRIAVLCEASLDPRQATSLAAITVFIAYLEKVCSGSDADLVGEIDVILLLKSRIWRSLSVWFDPQDPGAATNPCITERLTECWSLIAHGDVLSRKVAWDEYTEPAGLSSWERIASNETCRQCKVYFITQAIKLDQEYFSTRILDLLVYWIASLLQPSERLRYEHELTAAILRQESWTYRLLDNISDGFQDETNHAIDLEDLVHARCRILVQIVENIAAVSALVASSEDSQDKMFLLTDAELSGILRTMMKTMRNVYESLHGQPVSKAEYSILIKAVVQEMFNKGRRIVEIDPWFFETLGISQVGRLFLFQVRNGGMVQSDGHVSIQQVQWLQSRALSTALRGTQQSLLEELQSLLCNRAGTHTNHTLENRFLQLVMPVYIRRAFQEPTSKINNPIFQALRHTFEYCLFKAGFNETSNLVSFAKATFAVVTAVKDAMSSISTEGNPVSVSRTETLCSVLDFLGLALLQCQQISQVVPRGVPSRPTIQQYARYFFGYLCTVAESVQKDHPFLLCDQLDKDILPIDPSTHLPDETPLSPEDGKIRQYVGANLEKALRSWSKDTAGVWWAQQGSSTQRVVEGFMHDHAAMSRRLSETIETFMTQIGKIVTIKRTTQVYEMMFV